MEKTNEFEEILNDLCHARITPTDDPQKNIPIHQHNDALEMAYRVVKDIQQICDKTLKFRAIGAMQKALSLGMENARKRLLENSNVK